MAKRDCYGHVQMVIGRGTRNERNGWQIRPPRASFLCT